VVISKTDKTYFYFYESMLKYSETPLTELHSELLKSSGIKLLVKREDLNHPAISGNKWWKLKYNLEEAVSKNCDTVLTFGGAYSNHIYATAAAAKELNLKSIGIIRGEETLPLNKTLSFAKANGMQLHYISRELYREKNTNEFVQRLRKRFGNFYLIPEGGTNELAVNGCTEFATIHLSKIDFDYLLLPVGTGGTMAGLICGLPADKTIIGVSVLKDGNFLKEEVEQLTKSFSGKSYHNWSILTEYHHGGYAKASRALDDFISLMKKNHNLPLDHVYTGKLFWAVMKEVEKNTFRKNSTVLVLHTGGLQGSQHSL
jgi:1-aminocyclopropane-1-carboxylate deaminase